eukprot:SAG11_NODE_6332_length_1334_cov_3.169231_1_plen_73_part_00
MANIERLVGNVTVVGVVKSAGRTIEGRSDEFNGSFGLLDVRVYRARADRSQTMKNDDNGALSIRLWMFGTPA